MDVIVNCTAEFSDNNISTATGVDDVHTKVSMPRTKAADETNENDVEG